MWGLLGSYLIKVKVKIIWPCGCMMWQFLKKRKLQISLHENWFNCIFGWLHIKKKKRNLVLFLIYFIQTGGVGKAWKPDTASSHGPRVWHSVQGWPLVLEDRVVMPAFWVVLRLARGTGNLNAGTHLLQEVDPFFWDIGMGSNSCKSFHSTMLFSLLWHGGR